MNSLFYTMVFRKSADAWVALCMENGLVGQGPTKRKAVSRLQEAIASWEQARHDEPDIHSAPISIGELHEFLTMEESRPALEPYELRAVYA